MNTIYGFSFSESIIHDDVQRLTNQLWKLIPMKENEEDWSKQLNSVIIEIAGKHTIFNADQRFLQILSKLEGLKVIDLEFALYRKTVFECINLLQELGLIICHND